MATCVPGFEFVVSGEVKEKIKGSNNIAETRGKVTFDCPFAGFDKAALMCADNIYKLYTVFKIGAHKSDLPELGKNVLNIDFANTYFEAENVVSKIKRGGATADRRLPQRVIVSASRVGNHTYTRYDIAKEVEAGLISTGRYVAGDSQFHDIAVRVDVNGDNCKIYKQLTSSQTRFRGDDLLSARGGIRPTVAHCLVRISNPESGDVYYDPFCGAGTIPFELSFYKVRKIYASDVDADVLETARANLKQSAVVFHSDARKTKMKNFSVDKIVTNMPWGKQVKVGDIDGLYADFIKEIKRVMTAGGCALILTDRVSSVENICDGLDLRCARVAQLSLHGLHPMVFIIRK